LRISGTITRSQKFLAVTPSQAATIECVQRGCSIHARLVACT
jgi:hypothetical protein